MSTVVAAHIFILHLIGNSVSVFTYNLKFEFLKDMMQATCSWNQFSQSVLRSITLIWNYLQQSEIEKWKLRVRKSLISLASNLSTLTVAFFYKNHQSTLFSFTSRISQYIHSCYFFHHVFFWAKLVESPFVYRAPK